MTTGMRRIFTDMVPYVAVAAGGGLMRQEEATIFHEFIIGNPGTFEALRWRIAKRFYRKGLTSIYFHDMKMTKTGHQALLAEAIGSHRNAHILEFAAGELAHENKPEALKPPTDTTDRVIRGHKQNLHRLCVLLHWKCPESLLM
ncbi:hypothetical protein EMWEY_00039520 [Eimeria maxima]|uniref:Uncharacterized protein n=1 Tax=Eimeria maxima TaxID=5804 RepID=U6MHZ6_EIMMA|nr:hypothetical protein EMWEY_00039520 [Eimeria maxima]CDJ61275.1 hypothetical protein EMWEY_00039520 [Eimeria maxima]